VQPAMLKSAMPRISVGGERGCSGSVEIRSSMMLLTGCGNAFILCFAMTSIFGGVGS